MWVEGISRKYAHKFAFSWRGWQGAPPPCAPFSAAREIFIAAFRFFFLLCNACILHCNTFHSLAAYSHVQMHWFAGVHANSHPRTLQPCDYNFPLHFYSLFQCRILHFTLSHPTTMTRVRVARKLSRSQDLFPLHSKQISSDFHWILQSSLVFLALIPYSRLFAQSWLCTMWSGCKETQKKLQKRFPNAHRARSMWRIHKSSFAFLPAFFLLFIFSRKLLRLIVFIRPRWHWLNALLASTRFVSAMLYVYALISEQIEFNLLFRIRKSPLWQHFEIVF